MIDGVYNKRILELAADIPRLGRLADAQGSATAHSRLCGSTITVDLSLDEGKVCDFAQELKACALGQASASISGAPHSGRDTRRAQGPARDDAQNA